LLTIFDTPGSVPSRPGARHERTYHRPPPPPARPPNRL